MTLTLTCNLDIRIRPKFFSNLRRLPNYQAESRSAIVFNVSCGMYWHAVMNVLVVTSQMWKRETLQTNTLIWKKCIWDDTKAAARQSLNCIKTINIIWRKTIFNMADEIFTPCNVARSRHRFRQVTASCNVACGSGIVTVNSPSGSTLQCDTWLWDDVPLNSPKRPPYWNSTSGFHLHTSPQLTCYSVPVCEILSKSDHPRQKKWRHVDFSRWRISAILDCRN